MSVHDRRDTRDGGLDTVERARECAANTTTNDSNASAGWSRRRFLGAATLGGIACTSAAGLLVWSGAAPARSGLSARELAGDATLTFANRRTRPGFAVDLEAWLPAAERGQRVARVVLAHRRGETYEPVDVATIEVVDGRGRGRFEAPMSRLDAAERANEGFELVAMLVADDDRAQAVIGAPIEVVVSPFCPGM